MNETVFATIQEYGMFNKGDSVIAALSGGADSVALLHFLWTQQQTLGITLSAAHFEHGLRGEESARDETFCRRLCEGWDIPLTVGHGHMNGAEKPGGLGTEGWARQLRYAFFEELAAREGAKVATAHTLSDNAETVLLRLARGTGPRGLGGIPPVRGPFVRPLLAVSRAEIEDYIAHHRLAHVTDATNADEGFARNRLRHTVLPALETVHPGAAGSLARLAGDMRAVNEYLAEQARALLAQAGGRASGAALPGFDAQTLLCAPPPVRLAALSLLAGPKADRAALARMQDVLQGNARAAQLPGGGGCRLENGRLVMHPAPEEEDGTQAAETGGFAYEIPLAAGETILPGGYRLWAQELPVPLEVADAAAWAKQLCEKTAQKGLTFAADCDKIIQYGVLRTRRPGDRFAPAGRGVTKPLKKWMNEEKVPLPRRGMLPLLTSGSTVLWVWGAGFSQAVQPHSGTRRLLVLVQDT